MSVCQMETQTAEESIVPLPDSPFPAELEESLEGFAYENDTFLAENFDEVKYNLHVQITEATSLVLNQVLTNACDIQLEPRLETKLFNSRLKNILCIFSKLVYRNC